MFVKQTQEFIPLKVLSEDVDCIVVHGYSEKYNKDFILKRYRLPEFEK
jgi:hypothetical protein